MHIIIACLLGLLGQPALGYESGTAPFCKMDNLGNTQCYYYTLSACEDAIENLTGYSCVKR